MHIAGVPWAGKVVFQIVLFSCADTDISNVRILIDVSDQRQPRSARGWTVSIFREPSILYPRDHGKGEHSRGRSFWPGLGMVDQLTPHAVRTLIREQRLHHLAITLENAGTLRMLGRK